MDIVLLKRLRDSVPKNSWLGLLNDSQLLKIHSMLSKGTTNSEIIRTCQSSYGIKRRATIQELLPSLVDFRTKTVNDKALLKIEEAQGVQVAVDLSAKLRGLTSKVDALGRLSWLVDVQTQRVLKAAEAEKKSPYPMDIVTENIDVLNKMLHGLYKAQQELNIGDSQNSSITPEAKEKIGGLVSNFKDSSKTMIQATHQLLKLADERSLILRLDEDGKYVAPSIKEEEREVIEVST